LAAGLKPFRSAPEHFFSSRLSRSRNSRRPTEFGDGFLDSMNCLGVTQNEKIASRH
jgi:hypothetical protein